jgi:tetratricopeptide (TPR) repeat protein/tRNA A-37 threonylcarbamoyl transferase component Bud32
LRLSELRDRLVTALGRTYRLERELGGGGMSRVFLAEEVDLGRLVVVKVLPPEMAAGVNQDRFRREIQLAARLQHPHIVPVLSAGSSGDLLWYVMPFVEGESLRARLEREVELPVSDAVRLLREVTDALAYAHERGVVHRDIKPDNVMISSGHALVTDFGVAKAVSSSTEGGSSITSLGVALGTPAYMAPEQAAADPHVDHRADIYALGAMAYELLTGQPPFTGPTPQSIFAAHMTQEPGRISQLRPAVPAAVETVVMRCLEKRPADRWQKASDLLPQFDLILTPVSGSTPVASSTISSGTEAALRKAHPARVAVLFGLASLGLLSLTWWLVQRLGLPDWVVTAAAVLLVLGLPLMLMAAQRERERLLAGTSGRKIVPASGLLGRLTTLRGALVGGGLAFVGLVVGTAGFMGLRMLGVGPFATLVSAGVLKDQARLVLADFENKTSDSTLGSSITEAFRIDLSQSPTVRLMESRDVRGALERMTRPAGTPLDVVLAQEIAQREGASAVVAGEIAPLAGGYVLSVRLLGADGSTLLAEREIANDVAGIIPAVERLSESLREDIGESLRSIRAGEPLQQVTTGSLEALRFYSAAERANNAGRGQEAMGLLEQAVSQDSGFAMAWRKLAVVMSNWGANPERRDLAARRAYELRDRLPRREAALAAAYYFQSQGDRGAAIDAYRRLLVTWPDDIASNNNLAMLLVQEGRVAEAGTLLQSLIDSGATVMALYDNLIDVHILQRNYEAAERTVATFAARLPQASAVRQDFSTRLAQVRGDYDRALALTDSMVRADDEAFRASSWRDRANLLRLQGRLREAEEALEQALTIESAGQRPSMRRMLLQELERSVVESALLGRTAEARQRLRTALERYPLDSLAPERRPYDMLTYAWISAGENQLAAAAVRDFEKLPATRPELPHDLNAARGFLALAEGRYAEAVERLRSAARGWGCALCNLVPIGQAFEKLGQRDSALAAYERYATYQVYWRLGQDVELAPTYVRLGELHEERGDRRRALEYYGKFVDMWKKADPELQPRVADVRRRIAELTRQEN